MKKIQLVLCLILSLFFVSCGAKKVVVKYADTYIEKQVEKRLPLYGSQEILLSKEIDKFLNAHKDEARELIKIVNKIDVERPDTIDEQYPKLTAMYLEIARDFSRILARHMSEFDKKQQKDFLKNLREENNEISYRGKKERMEKIEKRVTHLLGEITKPQKKILQENAGTFDQQVVDRVERRSKLHNQFKEILAQEISSEGKEELIFDAFVKYQKEALTRSKNLEIIKSFIPTLTNKQKTMLKGRLAEMEEILTYFIETAY